MPAPPEQGGSLTSSSSAPSGSPTSSPPRGAGVPSSSPPESGPPSGALIAQPPLLPDSPKGTLLWRVRGMIRAMRPHQWVKNLFVLAPVVFAKHLTHPSIITSAIGAFAIFCLLAGAVYILNDIVDAEADRVHPVKRFRPIASGRVPIPVAKAMAVGLAVIALGASLLGPPLFAVVAASYYALNVAYSFRLKKIAYLDVGCIAVFFVLRVLAGGFATRTPLSGFMIACTALLALFLGFGKRRHELASANASKQRAALDAYTPGALTAALAVTGFATIATYLAYTLDHDTQRFFQNPYLWVTTIHPLFGVIRFLQLVAGSAKAESPTQEILRDTPFVLNLVMWSAEVLVIVYRLRPS
ncbi:decaprenyl-phosphate phosphoribosyltransferase [Sorangium sp. So ce1182]|uniref:decaprenyl-phosphate phosphoribosyltransferase n=1 Tax=Sorangium sp. So ce1182 TaxID=3133334 RepID=UPI003F5DC983